MKLHLPRHLAAAVLAACASVPVYAFPLDSPNDLTSGRIDGQLTYELYNGRDYTYSRTEANAPFISGSTGRDSLLFTAATGEDDVTLSFAGGNTQVFYEINNLSFTNLRRLKFSRITSGAIYSESGLTSPPGTLTISGIMDNNTGTDDIYFSYNSNTGNCGGAINANNTTIGIDNNGGIIFEGNKAYAGAAGSGNQNQGTTSGGVGVGVSQGYTVSLFGVKLSFEFGFGFGFSYEYDNPDTEEVEQMDICGGAINLFESDLTLNGNQAVTFVKNSAVDYGGAIATSPYDGVKISNNGKVIFQENTTSGHVQNDHVVGGGGGAIFIGSKGSLEMDSNTGDVIFINNLAAAAGGAIYFGGQGFDNEANSIALTNNSGNISFEGNTAGGTGGAIHLQDGGRLLIAGNTGGISFEKNQAGVSGGAISALNATVTIEHNTKEVIFCDNLVYHQNINDADSFSSHYVGGAIYGTNIQIHNNNSVLFQRNAEKVADDFFRLRSLHVEGNSALSEVSLSAGAGQTIEFRDSIYIAKDIQLHLNSGYANLKQEGDIIFTGATTVEDLETVKRDWGTNNSPDGSILTTEKEIEESRTSVVLGETYLNGGRLRVENGAIFRGRNIYLNGGSGATLRIDDAKVVNIGANGKAHADSFISVGNGTTLEILGHSIIEGGQLKFADGASWSFGLNQTHESWNDYSAALTFNGELNINGGITIILNLSNSDMKHRYTLYQGTDESYKNIQAQWTAENITVVGLGDAVGAGFEDLVWQNGNLYYESSMVWNNGQNTGEWDLSDMNWQNGKNFTDGMHVKFTNAGAGTVTLTENLVAGSIKVSNDKGYDYTFTAQADAEGEGGKLTYRTDLEKNGDGTLTIDLANDFTGTTKLAEGTLNLHDDKALGDSTLSTAEGTILGVGDNSNVVLDGDGHVIKGDVVVDQNSSLEIAGGSYKAPTSTVDGHLIFSEHAIDCGTLTGSGTLEVTNGASVGFKDATAFTGSVHVNNDGSLVLKLFDNILRTGELAVNAGYLTLQAEKEMTMAGGSILSMVAGKVAEKVTTVVADKLLKFAEDAILSAMLSSMVDSDGDDILNEAVGGQIVGAGLTLDAGSTLSLDNCFIGLNKGNAESTTVTLNVTLEDIEKIHLELSLEDIVVTEDSKALLFVGVDTVYFVYDDAIIGSNGSYECFANHYFIGDMIGENTKLVYDGEALYLTKLVPEPTTATLSLVALAALAARRRRK